MTDEFDVKDLFDLLAVAIYRCGRRSANLDIDEGLRQLYNEDSIIPDMAEQLKERIANGSFEVSHDEIDLLKIGPDAPKNEYYPLLRFAYVMDSCLLEELDWGVGNRHYGQRSLGRLRMMKRLQDVGALNPHTSESIGLLLPQPNCRVVLPRTCANTVVLVEHISSMEGDARVVYKNFTKATPGAENIPHSLVGQKVGFLPVVTRAEQIKFVFDTAGRFFSTQMTPNRNSDFSAKLGLILGELDEQGVAIAMLPEAVVETDVRDALTNALRDYTLTHEKSNLAIVIAGTTPVTVKNSPFPLNQSAVLGRKGQILWTQNKIFPWKITASRWKQMNLEGEPANDEVVEGMYREDPPKIMIADLPFGRVSIAICEDAMHLEHHIGVAKQAGITHLFVPVLSAELARSWTQRVASMFGDHPGAMVFMCNSGSIPLRTPGVTSHLAGFVSKRPWLPDSTREAVVSVGEELGVVDIPIDS